jgi:hypothetical protein
VLGRTAAAAAAVAAALQVMMSQAPHQLTLLVCYVSAWGHLLLLLQRCLRKPGLQHCCYYLQQQNWMRLLLLPLLLPLPPLLLLLGVPARPICC